MWIWSVLVCQGNCALAPQCMACFLLLVTKLLLHRLLKPGKLLASSSPSSGISPPHCCTHISDPDLRRAIPTPPPPPALRALLAAPPPELERCCSSQVTQFLPDTAKNSAISLVFRGFDRLFFACSAFFCHISPYFMLAQ